LSSEGWRREQCEQIWRASRTTWSSPGPDLEFTLDIAAFDGEGYGNTVHRYVNEDSVNLGGCGADIE
jgi:hypothetical protein